MKKSMLVPAGVLDPPLLEIKKNDQITSIIPVEKNFTK